MPWDHLVLPEVVRDSDVNKAYHHEIFCSGWIVVLYVGYAAGPIYLNKHEVMTPQRVSELFARARRNLSTYLPKPLLPSTVPKDTPHVHLFPMRGHYIAQLCLGSYCDIQSVNIASLCLPRIRRNVARILKIELSDACFLIVTPYLSLIGHKKSERVMRHAAEHITEGQDSLHFITSCTDDDLVCAM